MRAKVGDMEDVHEKLGEFVGPGGQGAGAGGCGRVVGEKAGVAADHVGTGAGRADHGVASGKEVDDAAGQGPDPVCVPELVQGLAAACLPLGHDGIDAGGAKDVKAGQARLGHDVLDEAGDEQCDAHAMSAPCAAAGCRPGGGDTPGRPKNPA